MFIDVDVARVDALAYTGEAVSLDDIVFLLDLPLLVEWRISKSVMTERAINSRNSVVIQRYSRSIRVRAY